MAEPRDDKVGAAYRAMPPSEPPPALDDAIRAAARRAVQAGPSPARRRWALPVSVAAVLALSIGIALHVEREKPVVLDGVPVPAGSAEYPVALEPVEPAAKSAPPPAAPAAAPAAFPSTDSASTGTAPESRPKAMAAEPVPAAREAKRENAIAPSGDSPPPAAFAPPPPAAAPPPPAAAPAASAPMPAAPALRAKDRVRDEAAPMRAPQETGAAGVARERAAPSPESRLERIAELRAAGRHGEADEALAKFRHDYPDYRIAPEWWEKVKPR